MESAIFSRKIVFIIEYSENVENQDCDYEAVHSVLFHLQMVETFKNWQKAFIPLKLLM